MVTLEPIAQAELWSLMEPVIEGYAQGHVEDGQWSAEEALERSRQEFHSLLPMGVATPDNYLFKLVNEAQQRVGLLWFAMRERAGQRGAFVYEISVEEAFRRRGYASQAFRAMEDKVRALGGSRISLHVFGNNYAAIGMYEKLGYEPTNIVMAKALDPAPQA